MGGFSKFLSMAGAVVGIAAAVASGGTLGVLAGAFLAVGMAANLGVIGGSIGKFMNSGAGRGLIGAVALGSVAYASYGQTALQAQSTAANTEIATTANASVASDSANIANSNVASVGMDSAAASNDSFLKMTQTEQDVANLQATHPEAALSTNTNTQSLDELNKQTIAQSQSPLGANAQQAKAQQDQGTQGAVASEAQETNNASVAGWRSPAASLSDSGTGTPAVAGGAGPNTPRLMGDTQPGSPLAGGGTAGDDQLGIPQSDIPLKATTPGPETGWGKVGGWLNKAMDTKGGAAAVTGLGSAIGGIGQGISQRQAIDDELKAQEWGNQQWQQPGQVANLMAATSRPITVPQGYLQRAQQVRAMMSQGVAPLPAAAPGAPLAPNPVHV